MTKAEVAMLLAAVADVARKHGIQKLSVSEGDITVTVDMGPPVAPPAPIRQDIGPARRMAENFHQQMAARQQAFGDGNAAAMQAAQQQAAAERRHATMFAASSIRPNLARPEPAESAVPRAVRAKTEAAKGGKPNRKKR